MSIFSFKKFDMTEIYMELFIDLNEKRLVQSVSNSRSVLAPSFMQGDSEPLILHLIKDGVDKVFLPEERIKVALGRFVGSPTVLTISNNFTPLENGGARVILPLNTVELEKAIGTSESIEAFFEVEYTDTEGDVITALQIKCRIKNDLIANSPSIEVREQYYDSNTADAIFATKESLTDLNHHLFEYKHQKFLESRGAYSGYVNMEYDLSSSFTLMFVYVDGYFGTLKTGSIDFLNSQYYEEGDILSVDLSNKKVCLRMEMDWETYNPIYHYDYDFNANLHSGDKLTIIWDSVAQNLKIYVNKVLASNINVGRTWIPYLYYLPIGSHLIDFKYFSCALDSNAYYAPYNVAKFNSHSEVPSYCYEPQENTPEYNFPSGFTGASDCLFEAGVTWQGVENCLKIYPTIDYDWQSPKITDICNGKFKSGVTKKVKVKCYYPTTNKNSTCVKFVSATDFVVYPKDEWQEIEFYKASGYANDRYQWVCFRNNDNSIFAGSGTGEDDVIYIASVSVEFKEYCKLNLCDIKNTDFALINKAYNANNTLFPYVISAYENNLIPAPTGRKPFLFKLYVGQRLSNFIYEYSSLRIWKIDVIPSSSSTTFTLNMGSQSFEILGSRKCLYLERPFSINYYETISLSSTTSNVTDYLTLKLYLE